MKSKFSNGLIKLLLIGILSFPLDLSAQIYSIKGYYPERRVIYVNEQEQIIKILGNSLEIPYKKVEIFKGKEKIKMSAKIDYQYNFLIPYLNFTKNKIYQIPPMPIPIHLPKNDGKPYNDFELKVIDEFYKEGALYPSSQILDALKNGNITCLENGKNIRLTIYPDEKKGEGYETISVDLIGEYINRGQ